MIPLQGGGVTIITHKKTETLYVIKGKLVATYLDLDTGECADMELNGGDLVIIQPRCAHVYVPLQYSQAVELASHPYDPNDTIPYQLVR